MRGLSAPMDLPPGSLLYGSVAFVLVVYLFETYIDFRQNRKYREKGLPKELAAIVPTDKFEKAQAYGLDKRYVK